MSGAENKEGSMELASGGQFFAWPPDGIDTQWLLLAITVVFTAGVLYWRLTSLEKYVKNGLTKGLAENTKELSISCAEIRAINERCKAHQNDIAQTRGRMDRLDERLMRTNERIDAKADKK